MAAGHIVCCAQGSNTPQGPQPASVVFYVLLDISIATEIESILVEHETTLVSAHPLGRLASKDFEEIKASA